MSPEFAVDAGLAAMVLAVAGWVTVVRAAFSAAVGFVAFGLLLALLWVRLAAVDVALTEAAIGSGLTGVVLLGAVARLRPMAEAGAAERPGAALRLAAAALSCAVAGGLAALVLWPPGPAATLAPDALAGLPGLGLGNPVTGVLMGYRAFDTLLEAVVLLLAVFGVWSLAPDRSWGGRPAIGQGRQRSDEPTELLARMLAPVGIVVGVYVFWAGSSGPGGEFQGGTILAAMWILVLVAGLGDAPPTGRRWLRLVLIAGPAVFAAIGLAGFGWAAGFLAYPAGHAKAAILAIEAPLTLSVAAMLAMLTAGPPAGAPDPR